MTWFRVDDGFHNHPKITELDMSAIGLWVLAGSYCARHLTDGVITDRQIRALGGTRKQAAKLVESGLWSVDDAPLSARRYAFEDWLDFQYSRDDVTAKRREDAERKRLARATKRDMQGKRENVREDVRVESERRSEDMSERSPLYLSIPNPTNKKDMRIASDDAAFEEWWKLYPRRKDRGHAEKAFRKAIKLVSFEDLCAATEAYAKAMVGKDPEYIAYGATWLNGKRWTDEDLAPVTTSAVDEWLRKCWQTGDTRSIEERSGLSYEIPDLPENVETPEAGRAFMLTQAQQWITENRERITERILRKEAA